MDVRPVEDIVQLDSVSRDLPLLGRRVNFQPLASNDLKIKSFPLSELSSRSQSRTQESLVVYDLLNVLVGLEGIYIRYNNNYDPYSLRMPEFRIAKMMDASLKSFCNKIVRLGKCYILLTKFSETWTAIKYGLVMQRLSFEIRQFLHLVYLRFVTDKLETEYKENTRFSIRELEQMINDSGVGKQMELLYNLCVRIQEEIVKRQNMDHQQENYKSFISDLMMQSHLKNDMILATDSTIQMIPKGSIILKILHDMLQENLGDKMSISFLQDILNHIATDYCSMLEKWLSQGVLEDPGDEFMICDMMKDTEDSFSSLKYGDRIWDARYAIRTDGLLPRFYTDSNYELLFKTLTTGKLLNVVRTSLGISEIPVDGNSVLIMPKYVELMEKTTLEMYVDHHYARANELCSKMYLEGYDLTSFLNFLNKSYFGHHNSHNISKFLSRNMIDLTRLFKKGIKTQIEERIQMNFEMDFQRPGSENNAWQVNLLNLKVNAQPFETKLVQSTSEAKENLSTAMVYPTNEDEGTQLLKAQNFEAFTNILLHDFNGESAAPDSSGSGSDSNRNKSIIHYLQIEMVVPYPLNIIVSNTCMTQYQIISQYAYLLQYNSKLLDDTWYEINKNRIWRYRGFSQEIKTNVITKNRLLHNRINQFIKLILEYLTHDVMDAEVNRVVNSINSSTTIVEWQTALQKSLATIITNSCMSQVMMIQLQTFEIVHKFCKFITSMREKLCRLNPELYMHYTRPGNSQADYGEGYNEDTALALLPKLTNYTTAVAQAFEQHRLAFTEGLAHYSAVNTTTTTTNTAGGSTTAATDNSDRLLQSLGSMRFH